MPVLDISIDDPFRTPLEITSVMLFPCDEQKRKQFKCSTILKGYLELKKDNQANFVSDSLKDYLNVINTQTDVLNFVDGEDDFLSYILAASPDCLDIKGQYDKAIRIVGLVFMYKVTIEDRHGNHLSKNQSVYIVSNQSGLSESSVKGYVSKYQSVAHMACAAEMVKFTKTYSDDKIINVNGTNFLDEENVSVFLSLAESLRLLFESDIEKKTDKPSLDPSCTWKVPTEYPIEAVARMPPKIPVDTFPLIANYLKEFKKKYLRK